MINEALVELIAAVKARGVAVVFEIAPSDDLRYVGVFRDRTIVLYSTDDPFLALFTVAHLFGHLCQLASGDSHSLRVSRYVGSGRVLGDKELHEITTYEYEAAQIGRALLAETVAVTPTIDAAYARLFFADSAYLLHFLRSGERGPALFERFLAAQQGAALITPDARLLRHTLVEVCADIVVV